MTADEKIRTRAHVRLISRHESSGDSGIIEAPRHILLSMYTYLYSTTLSRRNAT